MYCSVAPGDRLPVRGEPGGGQGGPGDPGVAAAGHGEAGGWWRVRVSPRQRAPGQREAPRDQR